MANFIGDVAKQASAEENPWLYSPLEGKIYPFPITHLVTIGRSGCDLNLKEDHISPRHCSLFYENQIFSLLDHGSMNGTWVNGKRLIPHKRVMISSQDSLRVGEVKLAIKFEPKEYTAPKVKTFSLESLDEPKRIKLPLVLYPENKTEIFVEEDQPSHFKWKNLFLNLSSFLNIKKESSHRVAHAWLRLVAIIGDLLFSAGIFNLVRKSRVVQNSLTTSQQIIKDFVIDRLGDNTLLQTGFVFLQGALGVFSIYIILRLIGSLVLMRSPSQALLGISSQKTGALGRASSLLRELLGFFTAPFLIFDLPTLFGLPSLKELLTFNRLYRPGILRGGIGLVLTLGIGGSFYLVSPFMQTSRWGDGLEVKRIEVADKTQYPPVYSSSLKIGVHYPAAQIVPAFRSSIYKGKKILSMGLNVFIDGENYFIKTQKTFQWKTFLNKVTYSDPWVQQKWPNLEKYFSSKMKLKPGENLPTLALNEFYDFFERARTLSVKASFKELLKGHLLLGPYLDFSHILNGLLMTKDQNELYWMKHPEGALIGAKKSTDRYWVIPVDPRVGRVFEIEGDIDHPKLLSYLSWNDQKSENFTTEFFSSTQVIDFMGGISQKNEKELRLGFEKIYDYYFYLGQNIVEKNYSNDLISKSLKELLQALDLLFETHKTSGVLGFESDDIELSPIALFKTDLIKLEKAIQDKDIKFWNPQPLEPAVETSLESEEGTESPIVQKN